MKTHLLRLFAFLPALMFLAPAGAQVVTTSPPIVQRSSAPIEIYFHADQGNKGLAGLTASDEVYAHTGVILEGSSSWSNAPTWLDNSDKYRLEYVSPDLWRLTIPSIDEYYGLDAGQGVSKLAFVFRNAKGSKEGKTATGGDIFVDVYPDGFYMRLSSTPDASNIFIEPTNLTLTVDTTDNADISVYVGDNSSQPIAAATGATEIVASYTLDTPGDVTVTAVARYDGETYTQTQTFSYVGPSAAMDYPGGTPVMGPVTNDDGSVTFCLAAPEKKSVVLRGSWNGYEATSAQSMHYQDYGGYRYFWLTVPNLADGNDHIYFFTVDGTTNVGDPYARLVVDPWNDKYISSSVFPNMPKYPASAVSGTPVAVYNSTEGEYDWEVTDFKGVDQSQLIIYELLIRDFTGTEGAARGSGTIQGVLDKLDYLQDLGVNAIELLPIMEFNGNNSWGYNTNFYFAPDKAYGTPDDYRRLVDEIHKRGMAVILDIVFNQTDGLHPWYMMYPIASNPFYNGSAPHAYSVLNDWNQDHPLVQKQFEDAVKYWIEEYHVDGYRFDLVKGLGTNGSYNATYDPSTNTFSGVTDAKTNAFNASRVARMKELHNAMRTVKPDAYFINENLAGAQEENDMAKDDEINWANINHSSCQFAMGYSSDSNMNRFYAPSDSRTWGSTVSYAESHDEERMAYKQAKYGTAAVKGNVAVSCRRLGSVAAQMLMAPGAHMIWQFQEFGADQTTKSADGGNNTSPKKVIWSYLDEPNHEGLMNNYRQLCLIRRNNPELFASSAVTTSMGCGTSNWSKGRYITLKKDNKALYLVVNPSTQSTVSVPLQGCTNASGLQLMSASYGTTPSLSGTSVSLEPGAYAVYGTANLVETPTVEGDAPATAFARDGRIVISGNYDSADVWDITGRRIAPDASHLPAGVYIVRIDGRTSRVIVH